MRARAAVGLLLAAACGGPPLASPVPQPVTVASPGAGQAPASRPAARTEGVDPAVLLPRAAGRDDELARVGQVVFHKRDVADRLFEAEPGHAQQLLNDLRIDALVHAQVLQHAIVVEAAPIEALLAAEEKRLRDQIERELGGRITYDEYLQRQFGLTAEEFRRWQRTELARARYRHYVARFLALREDRVVARVLTNADRALVEDLARRVAAGADFGTLAQRHSDDEETRPDGGLMVLSRGSAHPVVTAAFELQAGQASPVLRLTGEGPPRFALVYCVERREGRNVDFASVRAELDVDLERNPMTRSEWQVLFQRLTSASENLPSSGGNR